MLPPLLRAYHPPAGAISVLRGGEITATAASPQALVASALGWTLSAAALSIYTPMIAELVQKKAEV